MKVESVKLRATYVAELLAIAMEVGLFAFLENEKMSLWAVGTVVFIEGF